MATALKKEQIGGEALKVLRGQRMDGLLPMSSRGHKWTFRGVFYLFKIGKGAGVPRSAGAVVEQHLYIGVLRVGHILHFAYPCPNF